MKMYKGFHKNMTCKGVQYKEGITYKEARAELGVRGFHACEDPFDCFKYYAPGNNVYHEVELENIEKKTSSNTERCGRKITIGRQLSIAELYEAHLEYMKARYTSIDDKDDIASEVGNTAAGKCESASAVCEGSISTGNTGTSNDYDIASTRSCDIDIVGDYDIALAGRHGIAIAGEYGIASAGIYGIAIADEHGIAAAGIEGKASAGDKGSASVGYKGCAVSGCEGSSAAGEHSTAVAGDSGNAVAGAWGRAYVGHKGVSSVGYEGRTSAGNNGIASAGNHGHSKAGEKGLASAGENGQSSVGENGLASCRGGCAKGGIGAALALTEIDNEGRNVSCVCAIVDGEKIKADTWYKCVDGKLVKA